ncbi:hypothetical protein ACSQ67_011782 [Phaseolus vulgaris]
MLRVRIFYGDAQTPFLKIQSFKLLHSPYGVVQDLRNSFVIENLDHAEDISFTEVLSQCSIFAIFPSGEYIFWCRGFIVVGKTQLKRKTMKR